MFVSPYARINKKRNSFIQFIIIHHLAEFLASESNLKIVIKLLFNASLIVSKSCVVQINFALFDFPEWDHQSSSSSSQSCNRTMASSLNSASQKPPIPIKQIKKLKKWGTNVQRICSWIYSHICRNAFPFPNVLLLQGHRSINILSL